jgi:hypothetical protein
MGHWDILSFYTPGVGGAAAMQRRLKCRMSPSYGDTKRASDQWPEIPKLLMPTNMSCYHIVSCYEDDN